MTLVRFGAYNPHIYIPLYIRKGQKKALNPLNLKAN
jgi:hypothetical protein